MSTPVNLKDLFGTDDAVAAFTENVTHFLTHAENDYRSTLDAFKAKLDDGVAHAIAWEGERIVSAEYEASVAKRIAKVQSTEHVAKNDVALAAVLVLHHEYERFLSDAANLANSTGYGHRFTSMAVHQARAQFFSHTVGWRLGVRSKMHRVVAFAEAYYASLLEAKEG